MSKIQFDVNVANSVAISVTYDISPVGWMEVLVYPFRVDKSKSLLHAEIK